MSDTYSGQTLVGSEPIYSIKLNLPLPFTMDSVDFSATFYVSKSHSVTIQKAAMNRITASEYTCKVNTATMNRGSLNVEITVNITESGVTRKEIVLLRDIDRLY